MRARLLLILTISAVLATGLFALPASGAPAPSTAGHSWFAAAADTVQQQVRLISRLRAEERARLAQVAVTLTTPPPPPPPPVDDPSTFLFPADGPITSPYGRRWGRAHTGVDIDAPTGSAIVAAQAGTVILAGWKNGYGNTVIIDHGNGITTLYAHQARLGVRNGQHVDRGDYLGAVGATGNVTAAHLHYEVLSHGVPRNPGPWL